MKLKLVKLPSDIRGIYDINKDGRKREFPERALFAHPDLARALLRMRSDGILDKIPLSDVYRSAATSLARRREFELLNEIALKAGKPPVPQLALRPGESPHNWGLAIDIDVTVAMRELKVNKRSLDLLLRGYGLYCHRLDGQLGSEAWHYNALGPYAGDWLKHSSTRSTSRAVEAKIHALYAGGMRLNRDEVASALTRCPRVDGRPGTIDYCLKIRAESKISGNYVEYAARPLTDAVRLFQRDWDLAVDGIPGPKTQRLLAYLTSEKELVTL